MEDKTPQQPNQPQAPPEEKKLPKLPITILSFLLLISFGISGFLAYQNYQLKQQIAKIQPAQTPITETPPLDPDPTANWNTYTSTTLGFTFKYPTEYKPPEERENYLSLISPLKSNRGKGYELQNGELKIEIVTEPAKTNDSPTRCWDDNTSGGKILNQSKVDVSGTDTTIIDWEGYGTGQFICVIHNEHRYLINKYPLETTRQNEFYQILSTFKFTDQKNSSTTTPSISTIPILSTENWITVQNDGIEFAIPPEASCNDALACSVISWTYDYQGHTIYNNIRVDVQDYLGGSRREQFYNNQKPECHDIYSEAQFGTVKALQIAIDNGWCQGGGGGIVSVVGNKLVIVSKLSYDPDTNIIRRLDIRDTLVSTLKAK